jgi:hypothetical protein
MKTIFIVPDKALHLLQHADRRRQIFQPLAAMNFLRGAASNCHGPTAP